MPPALPRNSQNTTQDVYPISMSSINEFSAADFAGRAQDCLPAPSRLAQHFLTIPAPIVTLYGHELLPKHFNAAKYNILATRGPVERGMFLFEFISAFISFFLLFCISTPTRVRRGTHVVLAI